MPPQPTGKTFPPKNVLGMF